MEIFLQFQFVKSVCITGHCFIQKAVWIIVTYYMDCSTNVKLVMYIFVKQFWPVIFSKTSSCWSVAHTVLTFSQTSALYTDTNNKTTNSNRFFVCPHLNFPFTQSLLACWALVCHCMHTDWEMLTIWETWEQTQFWLEISPRWRSI